MKYNIIYIYIVLYIAAPDKPRDAQEEPAAGLEPR